jgi:hypothetical protein
MTREVSRRLSYAPEDKGAVRPDLKGTIASSVVDTAEQMLKRPAGNR